MVKTRKSVSVPESSPSKILSSTRKHKTFDDDEVGVEDPIEDETISTRVGPATAHTEDVDDSAPEVVHSSNAEIQYLQQLHDSITDSYGNKKKRKNQAHVSSKLNVASTRSSIKSEGDQELDADVFQIFEESHQLEEELEVEPENSSTQTKVLKIDKNSRKCRKM